MPTAVPSRKRLTAVGRMDTAPAPELTPIYVIATDTAKSTAAPTARLRSQRDFLYIFSVVKL